MLEMFLENYDTRCCRMEIYISAHVSCRKEVSIGIEVGIDDKFQHLVSRTEASRSKVGNLKGQDKIICSSHIIYIIGA